MQEVINLHHCPTCRNEVKSFHRFCYNCGSYLGPSQLHLHQDRDLQSAFLFFFIYLLVCFIVRFTSLFNNYNNLFWVEILLAVITLVYAVINFRNIKQVLLFRNFNWERLAGCILIAAIASIIINVVISKLNISFFGTDESFYERYSIYSMPALVMIYSIAVYPALFEELAFRGIIYNYLDNFMDEQLVVIITAFMFGIVHLNFISLFWLVPFGILMGIMRKRFGTIWYGVIFHFTFNFVAVLFDLYKNGYFK